MSASRFYVQTPNKWFFFEPHLLTPFIHWLPRAAQRRLLRYGTLWGWLHRPSPARVEAHLDEIRLLDEDALRVLFPGATLWRERVLGMTKSLSVTNERE